MVQDPAETRQKIENSQENREKCHCPLCPSYPHDCSGEVLYCGLEASKCDIEAKTCICDTCPLYYEYGLHGLYYCDKKETGLSKIFIRKQLNEENPKLYHEMVQIKDKSEGMDIIASMGSQKLLPFTWDDLHLIPAQIHHIPRNQEDPVDMALLLGPRAKKPFQVSSPLLISGMSFGAVSRNVRLVIGQVASELGLGFNSGEGGILKEENEYAANMIVQYSTGRFGIPEEILKNANAVEIRFGQGAYPGKGSFLPADKITGEVARIRGLERGEPAYSPAHHPDINNPQELKDKILWLRKLTEGAPVGAKIGCGEVEKDVEILVEAGVDFIALDGFGGATGATSQYVRDNVGVPLMAALPRAHKTLLNMGVRQRVSLIGGGGLRTGSDFAKCLSLGADMVYLGTSVLIAMNCEQYRVCYSGLCPTGVATQNPQLMKQLEVEEGVRKLKNFLEISNHEIANLIRILGKSKVSDLNKEDLVAISREIAMMTGVKWLNGEYVGGD